MTTFALASAKNSKGNENAVSNLASTRKALNPFQVVNFIGHHDTPSNAATAYDSCLAIDQILDLFDQKWHKENIFSFSCASPTARCSKYNMVFDALSSSEEPVSTAHTTDSEIDLRREVGEVEGMKEEKPYYARSKSLKARYSDEGEVCHSRRSKNRLKRRTRGFSRSISSVDSTEVLFENNHKLSAEAGAPSDIVPRTAFPLSETRPFQNGALSTESELRGKILSSSPESRGLTDADLEELRGFIDLGFKFPRDISNPRVNAALPALKLYHAIENVQERLVSRHLPPLRGKSHSASPQFHDNVLLSQDKYGILPPGEPWMVPTFNSRPADMKMHLRVWAQAVACSVRQAC